MTICKKCMGFGYIQKDGGHMGIPIAIPCECMIEKKLNEQAETAWVNLSKATPVKGSPLNQKISENTMVYAELDTLKGHLRGSFIKERNPSLFIKVIGDHQLMDAWLKNLHDKGIAVIDPDFQRSRKEVYFVPLVESPDLLIVRLGTKTARNSAMWEVLFEMLTVREHINKPTWLVSDPLRPFEEGHLSWSRETDSFTRSWGRVNLENSRKVSVKKSGASVKSIGSHKRVKL